MYRICRPTKMFNLIMTVDMTACPRVHIARLERQNSILCYARRHCHMAKHMAQSILEPGRPHPFIASTQVGFPNLELMWVRRDMYDCRWACSVPDPSALRERTLSKVHATLGNMPNDASSTRQRRTPGLKRKSN